MVTDLTDSAQPLIGALTVPGSDRDVLIPEVTVRRLLCDADITRVVTTTSPDPHPAAATVTVKMHSRRPWSTPSAPRPGRSSTSDALRTVTARLRRALEVRDGHCAFPGCHAHVRRCHAHHVQPWEDGGATDLPNLALMCVAHHHAVHEGGWTMRLRDGLTGHEQGIWEFEPPPLRRRRLRP